MPRPKRISPKVNPLEMIRPHAAGIDISATMHHVAIPPQLGGETVTEFGAFTEDLYAMRDYLLSKGITTVAMESTGVYWINAYNILEEAGFDVFLVDPRKIKSAPGRKSDVLDCQWIQQLHAYGLLSKAFRPAEHIVSLRTFTRLRSLCITDQAREIQHMQKVLTEMNIKLQHVVSDICGATGLKIIDSILEGERDPLKLANLRDKRCHSDETTIAKSLHGHYRQELIVALRIARDRIAFIDHQIAQIDEEIRRFLERTERREPRVDNQPKTKPKPESRPGKNGLKFDGHQLLIHMAGVDLTTIPGFNTPTALSILSETGTNVQEFKNSGHFASWLNLAPGIKKSGGKIMSSKIKSTAGRAGKMFRMAAYSQINAKSEFGDWLRVKRAHLGVQKALVAGAHKLARIYYSVMVNRLPYDPTKPFADPEKKKEREVSYLTKRANKLGFALTPHATEVKI